MSSGHDDLWIVQCRTAVRDWSFDDHHVFLVCSVDGAFRALNGDFDVLFQHPFDVELRIVAPNGDIQGTRVIPAKPLDYYPPL